MKLFHFVCEKRLLNWLQDALEKVLLRSATTVQYTTAAVCVTIFPPCSISQVIAKSARSRERDYTSMATSILNRPKLRGRQFLNGKKGSRSAWHHLNPPSHDIVPLKALMHAIFISYIQLNTHKFFLTNLLCK
jgi:hypothetical protein